jgi:tRNA threonylcarbamoyladenosine biosynthesis protein TsaE
MEVKTNSAEETQKVGYKLAQKLKAGELICLYGELGSGKTTFIQGIAQGLKIKKTVPSPTFIIVRRYLVKGQGFKNLYHIDLYRIENPKEIGELGLTEIINNSENVVCIEWAEKCQKILPKKRIDICFEYLSDNCRRITIFNGKKT